MAHVAAVAGHDVRIHDVDTERIEAGIDAIVSNLDGGVDRGTLSAAERDAALDRIHAAPELERAVADVDLAVGAVAEGLDLKRDVFEDVAAAAAADTVLATNTSSLSVTAIANVLEDSGRAVGLHFFNPPYAMGLVEVVAAEGTTAATEAAATEFVEDLGKEAVVVSDTAGFASSRLGIALGLEWVRMVEAGVADVEDIDTAMAEGYGRPMGALELSDHVGLDVRLDIAEHLREELGERFRPPQVLRRKVRAGDLGGKTGTGFYEWADGEAIGPAEE